MNSWQNDKNAWNFWNFMSESGPYAANRRVACKPFETLQIEKQGRSFVTIKNKQSLVGLEVIFGNNDYRVGWTVYVRGDVVTLPWAKEKYQLQDKEFILVPDEAIQIVTKPPTEHELNAASCRAAGHDPYWDGRMPCPHVGCRLEQSSSPLVLDSKGFTSP